MALHGWTLCSDDRWYHPVMAEDVVRAAISQERHEARKGKTADRVAQYRERKKAERNASGNDGGNALHPTLRNAGVTHLERTNRQETIDTSSDEDESKSVAAQFSEFWNHVPKKRDRGHAEKAYRTALKTTDHTTILAGAIRWNAEAQGQDPKFIPHPSTWLNGQRWLDEPAQEFAREPDRRTPAAHQPRRDPGIQALDILRRSREGEMGAEGAGAA
jgi:hypothetical protein